MAHVQGVRRLPFGLPDKVDEKLDDSLTKSKSDGDVRACPAIDMRKANEAIVR